MRPRGFESSQVIHQLEPQHSKLILLVTKAYFHNIISYLFTMISIYLLCVSYLTIVANDRHTLLFFYLYGPKSRHN